MTTKDHEVGTPGGAPLSQKEPKKALALDIISTARPTRVPCWPSSDPFRVGLLELPEEVLRSWRTMGGRGDDLEGEDGGCMGRTGELAGVG